MANNAKRKQIKKESDQRCRSRINTYTAEWKKKNRDKMKAYDAKWKKNNPEKAELKNFKSKISLLKIDLSLEQYKELFLIQGGVCAICKKPESLRHQSGTPRLLCIDHCHKTNKVRGLLCQKCNSGIGFFQDNPVLVFEAYKYLKNK